MPTFFKWVNQKSFWMRTNDIEWTPLDQTSNTEVWKCHNESFMTCRRRTEQNMCVCVDPQVFFTELIYTFTTDLWILFTMGWMTNIRWTQKRHNLCLMIVHGSTTMNRNQDDHGMYLCHCLVTIWTYFWCPVDLVSTRYLYNDTQARAFASTLLINVLLLS